MSFLYLQDQLSPRAYPPTYFLNAQGPQREWCLGGDAKGLLSIRGLWPQAVGPFGENRVVLAGIQEPLDSDTTPGDSVHPGRGCSAQSSCIHNSNNWKPSICQKEDGQTSFK